MKRDGHALIFHRASVENVADIVTLVNSAYRPVGDTPAWTHETGLVTGARITESQLLDLLNAGAHILLGLDTNKNIIACIQVENASDGCHLGMFAVDPKLQGQGIGKALLAYAESYAIDQLAAQSFRMYVLSVRKELLEFYYRRGYELTATSFNYHDIPCASTPLHDGLQVVVLEKCLQTLPHQSF